MKKKFAVVILLFVSLLYYACFSNKLVSTNLQIKDGYFWDPINEKPWIALGVAYQTWNKPLGQWQTKERIRKDLDAIVELGGNSVRVDFVWKHIEEVDDVFQWERYDFFLEEAKKRNLKVFALIGYQWPPDWFSEELRTKRPPDHRNPKRRVSSEIISYENPIVVREFNEFLGKIAKRYSHSGVKKNLSNTIGAWIVGNEYGYIGLWSRKFDGYDDASLNGFRSWLRKRYKDNIHAVNSMWKNDNLAFPGYHPNFPFKNFDSIQMPTPYGPVGNIKSTFVARDMASWFDLSQWREDSLANFISKAVETVKKADPHHLVTYSSVGLHWMEVDTNYHFEDARKISKTCKERGYPLDFWSINNFPWFKANTDTVSGDWGISRARQLTDLPVMLTEIGFTTTETLFPMNEKGQVDNLKSAILEAFLGKVMGIHIFHLHDRKHWSLGGREEGFGLMTSDGKRKLSFPVVKKIYSKIGELKFLKKLVKAKVRKPDFHILWEDATDTIHCRYQIEVKSIWGVSRRLGLKPAFITEEQLLKSKASDINLLVLPRNQKMSSSVLKKVKELWSSGVKIHANSDLPGLMNEYSQPRNKLEWLKDIDAIFGVDAKNSKHGPVGEYHDGFEVRGFYWTKPIKLLFEAANINRSITTWKYRDRLLTTKGKTYARFHENQGPPAVVIHKSDKNYAAMSMFAVNFGLSFVERYNIFNFIYLNSNGLNLKTDSFNSNPYVIFDYIKEPNGDLIIYIRNILNKSTTSCVTSKEFNSIKDISQIKSSILNLKACQSLNSIQFSLAANETKLLLLSKNTSTLQELF